MNQKRERPDHIDEAFLYERSINRETYERQRDQLREQFTLAEMQLSAATENQIDVEGVLAFAEHLVTNAARLWMALDQKQQLQQVLFPEGLLFDGEKFETAVTCLAFKRLTESEGHESSLASLSGFGAAGALRKKRAANRKTDGGEIPRRRRGIRPQAFRVGTRSLDSWNQWAACGTL